MRRLFPVSKNHFRSVNTGILAARKRHVIQERSSTTLMCTGNNWHFASRFFHTLQWKIHLKASCFKGKACKKKKKKKCLKCKHLMLWYDGYLLQFESTYPFQESKSCSDGAEDQRSCWSVPEQESPSDQGLVSVADPHPWRQASPKVKKLKVYQITSCVLNKVKTDESQFSLTLLCTSAAHSLLSRHYRAPCWSPEELKAKGSTPDQLNIILQCFKGMLQWLCIVSFIKCGHSQEN